MPAFPDVSGAELRLRFELPPGAYAKALLRELVSTEGATISRKI